MLQNNCLSKDGYIINQGKLTDIPYGKYTSDYNGCGWIATYNVMKLLGNDKEPQKIIHDLSDHTILRGKFGTNPFGIKKYLKQQAYHLKCTCRKKKFESFSKTCDAGIILYWNKKVYHYVAFQKQGEKYHFYNEIYGKEDDIRTMEEFLKETKIRLAYLYTITN